MTIGGNCPSARRVTGDSDVDTAALIHRLRGRFAPGRIDDEDVNSAILLIVERRVETITVEFLAQSLAVSRRTLERRFRDQLNLTVRRAIVLIRLEIASQLLSETKLSITAVSVEAGFSSPSRMSNVFRRELGCSPRSVRRGHAPASTPARSPANEQLQWVASWTTADFDCVATIQPVVAVDEVCPQVVVHDQVFDALSQPQPISRP